MREIIVQKKNDKVIHYIKNQFHNVPESAIYKALRQKDIRVNGVKISENITVMQNDVISIYIKDEILYGKSSFLEETSIIYDDENIVIVNKPKGILVQGNQTDIGLEQLVQEYFGSSSIIACHRLDRNTSGMVIFAKDIESESIIRQLMKNHEIIKQYTCLVYGHPKQKKATLTAYLFKDQKNNRVIISAEKKKGTVEIITKYQVIKQYPDNTSLLNVEIVSGKTHQIRAHLAFIGHPIIGDGKYGNNQMNQQYGKTWQELESNEIYFSDAYGKLAYLKGKRFCLR